MVYLEEFVNSKNGRELPLYIVLFQKRKFVVMVFSTSLDSSWCCDHQKNLMPLHLSKSCKKKTRLFFLCLTHFDKA